MGRTRSHLLPFEEARALARALKLRTAEQWMDLREHTRPKGTPCDPHLYTEFKDWADWLGDSYSMRGTDYLNYRPAKLLVHTFKLKSYGEWATFARSREFPAHVPKNPALHYGVVWKGWADWLGASYRGSLGDFKPFEEARAFVRSLGLAGYSVWAAYVSSGRKPDDIPARPDKAYPDQWLSIGDWVGQGHVYRERRSRFWLYRRARAFMHTLGLRNREEFDAYTHTKEANRHIPKWPERHYSSEWKSWEDWLGEAAAAPQETKLQYRAFLEAREFVRSLKLQSTQEWLRMRHAGKLPKDIPALPQQVYDGWWVSFDDWLGLDSESRFASFEEAKTFVHGLHLPHAQAWQTYAKSPERPVNIPSNPNIMYPDWDGWLDWLGNKEQ